MCLAIPGRILRIVSVPPVESVASSDPVVPHDPTDPLWRWPRWTSAACASR